MPSRIDKLIVNVDPRAKLPRHFDLWSAKMQTTWLKQHQLAEVTGARNVDALVQRELDRNDGVVKRKRVKLDTGPSTRRFP